MVDIRAQYQAAQTEQNAMLQMQELDQKMQQYGTMVQQGQMSAAQYMDTRQRGYETILNGYLQEMQIQVASLTAALEGVQGYATLQLTEAENDLAALNTQIDQVYRSIMVQSGINQSILDAVDQAYATSMKPMMDAITSLLAQENLSAQDEQLAFQYEALAIEEMNNYLQFGVGIADAAVNLVDALNPFKPKK
jgi:phage gp29-like protein